MYKTQMSHGVTGLVMTNSPFQQICNVYVQSLALNEISATIAWHCKYVTKQHKTGENNRDAPGQRLAADTRPSTTDKTINLERHACDKMTIQTNDVFDEKLYQSRILLVSAVWTTFLTNVNYVTFAIYYRRSVCLSVCDIGALHSAGWDFRQFFSPHDTRTHQEMR